MIVNIPIYNNINETYSLLYIYIYIIVLWPNNYSFFSIKYELLINRIRIIMLLVL